MGNVDQSKLSPTLVTVPPASGMPSSVSSVVVVVMIVVNLDLMI
jgi:hypothetical protein